MTRSAKVIFAETGVAQARSLVSPDAIKMFRPQGALMSRLPTPQPLPPENRPKPWLANLQLNVVQATFVTTPTFDVVQLTKTAILNPNLIIIRISIQGMSGDKINGALQAHREYFLPLVIFAVIQPKVGQTISERLRPDLAIAKKVRAQLPESAQPAAAATGEVGLLKVAPDFPEPMFDALATQSLDLIMPGLDKFPLNRCGLFESNQAFIEAYMVGLNHEMAREMLWREFPADLRQTFFRQFWDKSDTPVRVRLPSRVGVAKGYSPDFRLGQTDFFRRCVASRGAGREPAVFCPARRPASQISEHGRVHAAGRA